MAAMQVRMALCQGLDMCSQHGRCFNHGSNTAEYCECDVGFSGERCEQEATPVIYTDAHGTPVLILQPIVNEKKETHASNKIDMNNGSTSEHGDDVQTKVEKKDGHGTEGEMSKEKEQDKPKLKKKERSAVVERATDKKKDSDGKPTPPSKVVTVTNSAKPIDEPGGETSPKFYLISHGGHSGGHHGGPVYRVALPETSTVIPSHNESTLPTMVVGIALGFSLFGIGVLLIWCIGRMMKKKNKERKKINERTQQQQTKDIEKLEEETEAPERDDYSTEHLIDI